jgi:hypothetical protein
MNKTMIISIIIIIILVVLIYLFFSGREHTIKITEAQLQDKLRKRLPLNKDYFFIFEVTLENPRVSLKNGRKKILVGLDIILNIKINREPKPLTGSIEVSGGVKYDAEKGQFFITDPAVENLKAKGIPDKYTDKVNKALSKILTGYYATHPIYTLKTTDMKQTAAKLVLKNVDIHDNILIINLGV